MKRIAVSILVLVTAFVSSIVLGGELELTSPEEVGFSRKRLARIDEYVERHLEAHHFAGAVTLVARRGKVVQFKAYGMQDIEAGVPMSKDSIFRCASDTSPVGFTSRASSTTWANDRCEPSRLASQVKERPGLNSVTCQVEERRVLSTMRARLSMGRATSVRRRISRLWSFQTGQSPRLTKASQMRSVGTFMIVLRSTAGIAFPSRAVLAP